MWPRLLQLAQDHVHSIERCGKLKAFQILKASFKRANGFTHIPKKINNDKCLAMQKLKLIHRASIHPVHFGVFLSHPRMVRF